jgi:hypothetical protein
VREIAMRRGMDPKVMYRRFERILRRIRTAVNAQQNRNGPGQVSVS